MNTNVNLQAAVGVLAFLGTGFALLALGLVLVYALAKRKFGGAKVVALAGLAIAGLYLVGMVVFSVSSSEKVLARGEEKYFCEIDCHLAYSVQNVRRTKTLGEAQGRATAKGDFYVVTLRTRFDERTISPSRGNAPLAPNPRSLAIRDEAGRRYKLSEEGERALRTTRSEGTPLDTPLRPGESYTTELVFDLPSEVKNPVLLMNESDLLTRLIIGHENCLLHKQTLFRLEPLT
ncbi:MAG TPA: hypothetical protein VM934_15315 [Pyrinomonadaceae bacterium]|jgi:hypothetical protein|nr:hypothetical protein [Pyrinomonadaceae bacterium]